MQTVLLVAYVGLGALLLLVAVQAWRRGRSVFGRAPIHPVLFVVGKVALIGAALYPLLAWVGVIPSPSWVGGARQTVGAVVLLAGIVLTALALASLGWRTRMGLSDDMDGLWKNGVYRLSRNPMYLGLYVMAAGASLGTLDGICAALAALGILIHHRIVLAEEAHLEARFPDEYREYASKVRRYL